MKEKYEKVLIQEDYEKEYKNFDEFCTVFKTPENVMYWYKYNKINWPNYKLGIDDPNDKHFAWPDDILKTKIGNCWDHAIFFYYFCKKQNIPARMYRFAVYLEPIFDYEYWCEGHMVCICKLATGYYVCDYFTKPESNLYGPFDSFEDCAKNYANMYNQNVIMNVQFGEKRKEYEYDTIINYFGPYYSYMDNKGLMLLDNHYGKHDITQKELNDLDTSTTFEYDYKNIERMKIIDIKNKIIYYTKSFLDIIADKIFK